VSVLDESSDLEQLQNDQLPGSIHGGTNHQNSVSSNGNQSIHHNFSALSRGQLFYKDGGPMAATTTNTSGFSLGLGALSSDRQNIHVESVEGTNTDHQQSLESLESFQVTLDKRREGAAKQKSATAKPEANADAGLAKQLEEDRLQYQQKLRHALDLNNDIESQQSKISQSFQNMLYHGKNQESDIQKLKGILHVQNSGNNRGGSKPADAVGWRGKEDPGEAGLEESKDLIENIKSETFDMIQTIKNNHKEELIKIT